MEEAPSKPIEEVQEDKRVSFLAVGDNLIHGAVWSDPYYVSNGARNYDAIYENTNYLTQDVDVANINQETILGGEQLVLSHYPQFNSPQEIGDSLMNSGFDWISQASNHAYDRAEDGIISAMDYWDKHPDVITTGINRTKDEEAKQRIIEKDSIRFGLLNYTYGLNGFVEEEGKEYLVNNIDKEKIKADIEALKPNCDIILASMHWGVEYQYMQDEQQKELAQYLSDLGVSVIIGAHPHVIEPMEYITGKDGNRTLVAYSLGNFLSAQDTNDGMLGGMMKWDIVKDGKMQEYRIENAQFLPTVTWFQPNFQNFKTYVLKDYTDDLAKSHGLAADQDVSRSFFINKVEEVIGHPQDIEVIY